MPQSIAIFHQPSAREYVGRGYSELRATTREHFAEFDAAMAILLELVDTLDTLPAQPCSRAK